MFISEAWAQSGGATGGSGITGMLIPMVAVFAIFYFLLIRPQQKRAKEHKNMIAEMKKGDRVVAAGGVIGKITKLDDAEVELDLGAGVKMSVVRDSVSHIMNMQAKAKKADAVDTAKGKK